MSNFNDSLFSDDDTKFNQQKFTDSPEFEKIKDEIVNELFNINSLIGTLQHFLDSLQTFIDKRDVNGKIIDNIDKKSIEKINEISKLIKKINSLDNKLNEIDDLSLDKLQILAKDKILRDIKLSVQEFQNIQKNYKNTIKEINNLATITLNENSTALLIDEDEQQQHQTNSYNNSNGQIYIPREAINNEELAYQQTLIRQRDEEIQDIERGIVELNGIFKDLSSVIQQQGTMVDNIEENIFIAADNTRLANDELNKALRYQKKSNKFCLHILIFFSIMFLLFLFVIII